MVGKIDKEFARGPYGEILPPPLVAGHTPADLDEILQEILADDEGLYDSLSPTERQSYHGQMLIYLHQERMMQAFAGEFDGPDAADIYQAVVVGSEAISLRPPGMEEVIYQTFAPVLQRIGPEQQWRFGVEGQGHFITLTGAAPTVLRRARQLYVTWAEAED